MVQAPTRQRVRGPDRRQARRDRRRGLPDSRPVFVERRSGRPDRRLGGERRHASGRTPRGPLPDAQAVFWAANVACWAAVTAFALAWPA